MLTDAVDKVVDSRYPIDEDLLLTRIENEEILVPDPNRSRVSRHQHNSESKRVYKLSEHNLQRYVDHIDHEIYRLEEKGLVALFRCVFNIGTFFGIIRVYTVLFSDPFF